MNARGRSTHARLAIHGCLVAFVLTAWAVTVIPPAVAQPIAARPAVVRGNQWHLRDTLTSGVADAAYLYGSGSDVPIMGDWDGDGLKTPGVVRGNVWHLRNSNSTGVGEIVFGYGKSSDIPIVGDWDGDGIDTPGVVREHVTFSPPDAVAVGKDTWHLRNSNTTGVAEITIAFAFPGSPIVGDWDGDGDDGVGIRVDGGPHGVTDPINRFELDMDLDGTEDAEFFYGSVTDFPIAGDWDGDGDDSVGVVRGNVWHLKNENTTGFGDTSFAYGKATDYPLVWGDTGPT